MRCCGRRWGRLAIACWSASHETPHAPHPRRPRRGRARPTRTARRTRAGCGSLRRRDHPGAGASHGSERSGRPDRAAVRARQRRALAAPLAAALGYIRAHPQIWEVVLTGGDPLVLSARRLAGVAAELAAIEHVKILRVHTRVPIAAPARVTPALVRALKASGKTVYVAVHVNHSRELSRDARRACARFVDAGIPLLSQTVLLRGVNDDAQVLGSLMRAFVECRIKPYYLHQCDLAPGTAHWRTGIARGQSLMRALRGRYSGLCQPTYVLDIPGGHGKAPIGPSYLRGDGES